MKYALVENNVVTNIVLWDGVSPFETDGELIPLDDDPPLGIGWHREGSEWIAPTPEIESPPVVELDELQTSALEKLMLLGLTEEEARSIAGLPPAESEP